VLAPAFFVGFGQVGIAAQADVAGDVARSLRDIAFAFVARIGLNGPAPLIGKLRRFNPFDRTKTNLVKVVFGSIEPRPILLKSFLGSRVSAACC
jgi:hypothetical protein